MAKFYNSYAEYLRSDEWRRRSSQRIKIDGGKCQMCGNTENIHVHHLTYHNIFLENVYTDLVTLCGSCHEAVHRMMNRINDPSGRRGWKDTLSYSTVSLDMEKESEVAR